ncbi:alcohol dehydrogenase [Diplodia corticola]|uniref:Alcohol dehydrogenase n=1 Tax=Diplodia corticola TaxID=236234 RepID=A0A1J9RG06_9PEZI|nr:alcohol dehydrogenase [Diplodia corticola]OJD40462.1 alcohol dehydrogenase [Diplodia corticola]
MNALRRLLTLQKHLGTLSNRGFATTAKMATNGELNIDSKYQLNSGYEIPALGFGVYQTPAAEAAELVKHAIANGYRHVDSARAYRNEKASATGLLAAGVPRSSLFFTSKVAPKAMSYESAKADVEATLQETGLDYIDLYLVHAPYGGREARLGAWKALVEAVEAGSVRSIGVSNYGVHHLEELEAWIKETEDKRGKGKGGVLSVNQVELHPWLARDDIVQWCRQRGVLMEAYCPLVRATKNDDPLLVSLASKHAKTSAQVLLRWGLQKGFVILPKTVTLSRIEENANIFDFKLDAEDMKSLETGAYAPCAWDPTVSRD